MTIDIILFAVVFLAIFVLVIFLVKKRRERQLDIPQFDPEGPVTHIFRHLDDL